MAGYSARSLPEKLGLSGQARLLLDLGPKERGLFDVTALGLDGFSWLTRIASDLDTALLVTLSRRRLEQRFALVGRRLTPSGALWVCWPKRASGVPTDLHGSVVRSHGLAVGLVDVKVAAIDDVWSGLKFVRRLADR